MNTTDLQIQTPATPPRAVLGSRDLFPGLEPRIYANHASLSPPSQPVLRNVQRTLQGYAVRGMSWYAEETARRERLRGSFARMLGADEHELALVANTTAGVLAVAHGLRWKRADRLVVFGGEFPTNVTPWQQAAHRNDLELVWLEADPFRRDRAAALERLEGELRRGVRLVAVSAVQFTTGQRMPLEQMGALCRQYGAELFVDAIQALGIVPLDVRAMQVDYLTAGSHKWLMGPEGVGALYVSEQAGKQLQPAVAGWLSVEQPFAFLTDGPGHLRYDRPYQNGARLAEAGTPNSAGVAGLEASVRLIEQLGVKSIFEHVQHWHDAVEPGLAERGFESARMEDPAGRSGILSLRPPDPALAPAWARELAALGIACATPDGWLRLSPHWPNPLDEAEFLLAAFDRILARGGPKPDSESN